MENGRIKYGLVLCLCILLMPEVNAQKYYRWAFETNQYDKVNDFNNLLAITRKGLKKGYIDTTGREFIPPTFNIIDAYTEGLASAGFTDFQKMESRSGYIDRKGNFVIDPAYDVTSPFQEGIACVKTNEKWGYIDKRGRMIIDTIYSAANIFHNGVAAVKKGDKWGVINRSGRYVIPLDYDYALGFREGLCGVKIGDKWGYINRQNEMVIQPQFSSASNFQNGIAKVELDNKFGYIGKDGSFVIQPQYALAFEFTHDLACVQYNGKWGFIDREGNWAIPAKFDQAYPFSEHLARFQKKGKWGYINLDGEQVIEPHFDRAHDFNDELARVKLGNKKGFIRYHPPLTKEIIADKPDAEPQKLTRRKINPNAQRVTVQSPNLVVKLYDHKRIDGDIVSINYKGNWIIDKYKLTASRYEFKLDVEEGAKDNYLLFYANNLGSEPPNTAAIIIEDGVGEAQKVILNADLKQCDLIYFDLVTDGVPAADANEGGK